MTTRTASPLRNGDSQMSGPKLASLLRECADCLDREQWDPVIYEALGELHAYCAGSNSNGSAAVGQTASWDETKAAVGESNSTAKPTSSTVASSSTHQHKHFKIASLGKKFAQQVGLAPVTHSAALKNPEKASATSQKNASRAKADLDSLNLETAKHRNHADQEWCEEHFCVGCACKEGRGGNNVATATTSGAAAARSETTNTVSTSATTTTSTAKTRPAFQRPTNPKSTLIANGWMEQQRRSRMRVVWKEVLASLVEGRREGEETTLWIQREVQNGEKTELEALHQIPIKWVEGVEYLDYSTDHRFAVKVYNVQDDFLFRCVDEDSAQNWVLTLRSVKEIASKAEMASKTPPKEMLSTEQEAPDMETPAESAVGHRMPIKELRAIAHGHGVNTMGMERSELEGVVAGIIAGGTAVQKPTSTTEPSHEAQQRQVADEERRAKIAEEEQRRRQASEAEAQRHRQEEEARRRQAEEEQRIRHGEEERRRRQAAQVEAKRRQQLEEEQRRKVAEAEALRRRQAEEEQRRRQAAAEAEAQRRRQAEEEQRRRAHEEAQRQQWQQYQQQQQWQQQQQRQQQQQQWQQQQFRGQQQVPVQQHFHGANGAPPPGARPQQAPSAPHAEASPASDKYAKMAHQTEDASGASVTAIKHSILIHWALQPPQLQMLRPIQMLLSSVHTVFPPSFGVAGHEYFKKWTPLPLNELTHGGPMGNAPDDTKLKKAVRKLRFFLHPDKLPSDLNDSQLFMCKMLWDITNDAWEEHQKHTEDLDWMRK